MELIDVDKHIHARKVRNVGWSKLELIYALVGSKFDLDNINNAN